MYKCFICSICEAKVGLGGRVDKRSMKYIPSTLQSREDYLTVSKLYLGDREMDKMSSTQIYNKEAENS